MLTVKKRIINAVIVLLILVFMLAYANLRENDNAISYNTHYEETDSFTITNPRVDYITNPVGVDNKTPFFSWEMVSDKEGEKQQAYRIRVFKKEKTDKLTADNTEKLTDLGKQVWDSGFVLSRETNNIVYKGEALKSHTQYAYEMISVNEDNKAAKAVRGEFQTAYIQQGNTDKQPFQNAQMIQMQGDENVYDEGQAIFIKEFSTDEKKLTRATLYASALGIYDAYINGERVGNDELKPGWSDFHKSLYYNTYDVTKLLTANSNHDAGHSDGLSTDTNRIAVMLGTGWWCGRVSFGTYDYHKPAFIGTIRLEYEDGTVEEINTGTDWQYVKDTAVVSADIFNGEVYDANKLTTKQASLAYKKDAQKREGEELSEKKTVGGQPLKAVEINHDFTGEFRSFYGSQVKNIEKYDRNPVKAVIYDEIKDNGTKYGEIVVKEEVSNVQNIVLQKGETAIFDMGQNMTGVPYLNFSAPKGAKVTLDFAEMLNDSGKKKKGNDGPKGSLYTANYRSAVSELTLISNGEDNQEYQPVFTYYGFRYLSVCATEDIVLHGLKGKFIGNSAEETGQLVTDNELINRLCENIKWTQRNNFLHVATDCPQRDERLGWTGDLQVFAKTSLYNQDLYSFYRKWCQDSMDSQTAEGAYTDTVPAMITTGSGNAGWGDAGISVPLDIYSVYGNEELLKQSYDSMQRYMKYIEGVSNFDTKSGRVGPLTSFGDWLGVEDSDKELVSTLYYAKDAEQMADTATLLGDHEAAKKYQKLYKKIQNYFQEKYMADNHMKEEYQTQTTLALALSYGVLEEEQRSNATKDLKDKIKENGMRLSTGFLGTPTILKALSDNGELDTAYKLLLQEKNPSWIYSIKQGATTIWERYDSYTKKNGFADVAMNSFNHFNNGSVLQWMYEDMLGIKLDKSDILLKPGIILDYDKAPLHQAEGSYQSVYGGIKAAWKIEKTQITYEVTIPANCEAQLSLPVYGSVSRQEEPETGDGQITQISGLSAGNYIFIYNRRNNEWENR